MTTYNITFFFKSPLLLERVASNVLADINNSVKYIRIIVVTIGRQLFASYLFSVTIIH